MGVRPPLALAFALATGWLGLACRQVAGIEDIEPPRPAPDAGPRCACAGCTTLAAGLGFPVGIVLVGTDLFVTDYGPKPGEGALLRIPTAGGPVERFLDGITHPSAIAADATHLYWLADDGKGHGFLETRAVSGGPVVELAHGLTAVPEVYMMLASAPTNSLLALTATDVYIVDFGLHKGGILSVPKRGGPLGTFLKPALADAGTVSPVDTLAIATDKDSIVLIDSNTFFTGIVNAPLPSGQVRVIADNLLTPSNLASSGNDVLFCDIGLSGRNGTLQSVPKSGGAATVLLSGLVSPWAVVADDAFAYCASIGLPVGGSIVKVALDGGPAIPLVPKTPQPFSLVVDSADVYWVDPVCKTVMKVPK